LYIDFVFQLTPFLRMPGGGEFFALSPMRRAFCSRPGGTPAPSRWRASIVLVSSSTSISGTPALSVYSGTKAAIRNWILDLKHRHIRVEPVRASC